MEVIKQEFNELTLQLGDVIKIIDPLNENLNNETFFIDYISTSKIKLINVSSFEKLQLKINEGIIGNGTITQIELLSRASSPSYAIQNNLLPGSWVNIYFGGDFPVIITGLITNLEEDMIEITTPSKEVLYINFEYKGLPEDYPLETIELREKPSSLIEQIIEPITEPLKEPLKEQTEEAEEAEEAEEYKEQKEYKELKEVEEPEFKGEELFVERPEELEEKFEEEFEEELPELELERKVIATEKLGLNIPVKEVKERLKEIILRADQIEFGDEELGPIIQYVDVGAKAQRFSLETQTNDLLDDLLSTIPNSQRTTRVLNNIHVMIERFKQLREKFSLFDNYGNVEGKLKKQANYKPLLKYLQNFNTNLYWLLPVVKNTKKVYNIQANEEENNDVIILDYADDINSLNTLIKNYKANSNLTTTNNYSTLMNEINPYFTPFNNVENDYGFNNSIIIEKEVHTNLNVLVDNLENMYSSVFYNNGLRNQRFVINRYNLSQNSLQTIDKTGTKSLSGAKSVNILLPMYPSDKLTLKSLITLPEPTLRFSKINMPTTDVLTRANLNQNFLNYWQLLKTKTNINPIVIDNINEELEFDENLFVNTINNYILNTQSDEFKKIVNEEKLTYVEIYNRFINCIIPKTKILFSMMKKYIKGKLSIIDVISFLEPFLIYSDDLTYKQYQNIIYFLNEKISDYNKNIAKKLRIFKIIDTLKSSPQRQSRVETLYSMLSPNNIYSVAHEGYAMPLEFADYFTFSNLEFFRKIIITDCGRLFTTAISTQSIPLMYPDDLTTLIEDDKSIISKELKQKKADDEKTGLCQPITIAKLYTSLQQLENDNGKDIYFDKKYDKTNYGVMEDINGYAKEVMTLNSEQLREHIIKDLMKKNAMKESDAIYLANTLLDGNKLVLDGQYALLYLGYAEKTEDEYDYYIRRDNIWVLDSELSNSESKIKKSLKLKSLGLNSDESSLLCDLQEQCINVALKNNIQASNNCETTELNDLNLQNQLLKSILNEFDERYHKSKEQFEVEINEKFEYFKLISNSLLKIQNANLLKNNNKRFELGLEKNETLQGITSPYSVLLDLILSQRDFVKKQNLLLQFSNKFCRRSIEGITPTGIPETPHWYYCIKTNVPLIPAFKIQLAYTFIKTPNFYNQTLDNIKATIGQLSDDGDWWTDKHSGWSICPGDFSIDEGFEEGFRVSTRALLQEEIGEKINALANQTENPQKKVVYNTPDTIALNNIINSLSTAMGINLEHQKEFIMNGVLTAMKNNVMSELLYKDKIKEAALKNKKLPSFKEYYNTSLLFFCFGMYLIALQTSIPTLKTRKTHPGCVRSFSGYPFEGNGDLSSLTYLSCVIYDIRSISEPWNVLKKTNITKIQSKIKLSIDELLIGLPEVQQKILEKTEYLLTSEQNIIPKEHTILNWSNFLPPLIPYSVKNLSVVSNEFKRSLNNDLKMGLKNQREKILVLDAKIISYSLAIQQIIQDEVKKQKLLLVNSNNEPYLENACCSTSIKETTLDYFKNLNSSITNYNSIVEKIEAMLLDIRNFASSQLLYSPFNSKLFIPNIDHSFSEKNIYLAFIIYCSFANLEPIKDEYMVLCNEKPARSYFESGLNIEKIIEKMKEDGYDYNNTKFLKLIQLVSKKHKININLNPVILDNIQILNEYLEILYDEPNENTMLDNSFINLLKSMIENVKAPYIELPREVKTLNNYLITQTEIMKEDLKEFITSNSGVNISRTSLRNFFNSLDNLNNWELLTNANDDFINNTQKQNFSSLSDAPLYSICNFNQTFIENFCSAFPNIILNKVPYEVVIPSYYGYSSNHNSKLKNYITNYYEQLKTFYGLNILNTLLNAIQIAGNNLIKVIEILPHYSTININGSKTDNEDETLKNIFDRRTSLLLNEYFIIRIFTCYMEFCDNDSMLINENSENQSIQIRKSNLLLSENQNYVDQSQSQLLSIDYIDDNATRVDLTLKTAIRQPQVINTLINSKAELKQIVTQLIITYMEIYNREKSKIDINYNTIQDSIFKLKEREKDMVTDRLKAMTDEERDADTLIKITKQGIYSRGLQKGLMVYDKDYYEEEQLLRDEMTKAENKLRLKNKNINEDNLAIELEDILQEQQIANEIENDAYNMTLMNDDYYDGNVDGLGNTENDYDDYDYYN